MRVFLPRSRTCANAGPSAFARRAFRRPASRAAGCS